MDINIEKVKLTPGNTKQKGRRSAPKAEERQTGKDEPYAYTFSDPRVGELKVLNSSNAWWIGIDGAVKLQKLVDAYCFFMTDDEAISYAGISKMKLEYFQRLHPDFYGIKHLAKSQPDIHAKKVLVDAVKKDTHWAAWWISRTQKNIFSTRSEVTGENGRDLYDGLASEIRTLGEELRKDERYGLTQEHSSEHAPGNITTGGNGDRPETEATKNTDSIPEVHTETGESVQG